ncbi:MAG: CotH kinase family protein [Deltaproteobacteria bacterium]|nr:CotH kinase family protein [Deltaproteobacteria bacterium]
MILFLLACDRAVGEDTSGEPEGPADDPVWDDRYLPVYRITIDAEDWAGDLAALHETDTCEQRNYRPASVDYENPQSGETESYDNVGIRYRGHSALEGDNRFGFKLSFDEYDEAGEFHGLHKVNLNGTEGDSSLMRERLAQWVMRSAGVPAPRVTHTRVYVNGEYQGIFPFTEEPDDQVYLDAHFDDPDGSLFKINGYCEGDGDFEWKGDEVDKYDGRYEAKAGTGEEAFTEELIPMIACASDEDDAAMLACVDEHIDVAEFFTEIAVDMALPDVDGMAAVGQNFLLYHDPSTGLFVAYPWDKDQSFRVSDALSDTIWDLHPTWKEEGGPEFLRRLRALRSGEFCDEVLRVADITDPAALGDELDRVESLLDGYIGDDPWFAEGDWSYHVESVREAIAERHEAVVAEATSCTPP